MIRPALLLLMFAVACGGEKPAAPPQTAAKPVVDPKVERGRQLVAQYGCTVCHVIPGIEGSHGQLGPSLAGVASRPTLSEGAVQNTPANLAQFIQSPASLNPQSSMPPMGVDDAEADALAAFLLTLK
ncbi:MAG TPA: c-type cytochrome [Thermoanaerobaculia bacterium]|jgi:cytochrome c2